MAGIVSFLIRFECESKNSILKWYLAKGSSETLTDEQARNKEELEDVLGPEVNDKDFGLESKFQSRLFKI